MTAQEWNFDGLIGPTHNFAGLGPGNVASQKNRDRTSRPRAAALQGLDKMAALHRIGVPQAVLPPQRRPNWRLLHAFGFRGPAEKALADSRRENPYLLATAMSASCMWTANAATVCPSIDSADGRVHFTPSNLVAGLHRRGEVDATARVLRQVFADSTHFVHHEPLPASWQSADEGAANHTRFRRSDGETGIHLFVHGGNSAGQPSGDGGGSGRVRPRQTELASRSIARLHGLEPKHVIEASQNPAAINAGVFHNDVIAVGHLDRLFCHELAFMNREPLYASLRAAVGDSLRIIEVAERELPLRAAVESYLFNSQVVNDRDGRMVLIAPRACETCQASASVIQGWIDLGAIDAVIIVDVDESLDNGGGPACLRLRVELTEAEASAIGRGVVFTTELEDQLRKWVGKHHRESLSPEDLADPELARESEAAMNELESILGLELPEP